MKIVKKMRRITVFFVVLLSVLGMTACGKSQEQDAKEIYIGVACYEKKDTYLGELMEAFKTACTSWEDKGYDISMNIMDAAGSQKVQNDQVQEMVDDGCNVLCVNLADRTNPSFIIELAKSHDIPVIFFNREPVEEDLQQWDRLYYVGAKAKESGMLQGQLAADLIKNDPKVDKNRDGKIQYVILEGEMGHQDAIIRTESVVESLKDNGIELEKLSYQIANWKRAQAQNCMTQLIGQFKTQIELVIANNDAMALGARDAYEKLGYTQANLPIFLGIDGTKEGLEAVKASKLAATVYNDKEGQADAMVTLAVAVTTGEGMNAIDFENEAYIYLPYRKVTKENVEAFMDKNN